MPHVSDHHEGARTVGSEGLKEAGDLHLVLGGEALGPQREVVAAGVDCPEGDSAALVARAIHAQHCIAQEYGEAGVARLAQVAPSDGNSSASPLISPVLRWMPRLSRRSLTSSR